jgi:OLD-like protein
MRVDASAFPAGGPEATDRALARADEARAIVLVEGYSDQIAVETLAARQGRDLPAESVAIVPVGGAQAVARVLARFDPGRTLAGLCDAGEAAGFRRSFERAGHDAVSVCVEDLEDELIRAHGPAAVETILEAQGDLGSFRTFQRQPAWRGRELDAQLRRFMGSADRRKIRYARILVEALDPSRVPRPLAEVLARIAV